MSSRTVALDNEAYELLRSQKRAQESFSQTVKRLARPHKPLASFAGIWSDLSAKDRKGLDQVYAQSADADRRRAELLRSLWK